MSAPLKARNFDKLFSWFRNYQREKDIVGQSINYFRPESTTIAELGSGSGNLSLLLNDLGLKVIGLERDEEMLTLSKIKTARLGKRIKFIQKNLLDGYWEYKPVDVAVASFSLIFNFFPRENLGQFLRTAYSLLKTNGLLILNGFCKQTLRKDFHNGTFYKYGINPWKGNSKVTYVRVIYNRELVTLNFYHQLDCMPKPIITTHVLRPYSLDELKASTKSFGFRFLNAFAYPQSGAYIAGESDEFYAVFAHE